MLELELTESCDSVALIGVVLLLMTVVGAMVVVLGVGLAGLVMSFSSIMRMLMFLVDRNGLNPVN